MRYIPNATRRIRLTTKSARKYLLILNNYQATIKPAAKPATQIATSTPAKELSATTSYTDLTSKQNKQAVTPSRIGGTTTPNPMTATRAKH